MWKLTIFAFILGGIGYVGYGHYTGGFHTAPTREPGDYHLSFKSGVRAVMRGMDDERVDRNYLGYPATNVPSWYEDTWSICRPPTDDETTLFLTHVDVGPGGRLDAVCEIDADGDIFIRGWVASFPDL